MRPRSNIHQPPIFFRLWFGFILALILCIWGVAGFIFYTAATNPEAIGQHVGRMVGGAVEGFQQKPAGENR